MMDKRIRVNGRLYEAVNSSRLDERYTGKGADRGSVIPDEVNAIRKYRGWVDVDPNGSLWNSWFGVAYQSPTAHAEVDFDFREHPGEVSLALYLDLDGNNNFFCLLPSNGRAHRRYKNGEEAASIVRKTLNAVAKVCSKEYDRMKALQGLSPFETLVRISEDNIDADRIIKNITDTTVNAFRRA